MSTSGPEPASRARITVAATGRSSSGGIVIDTPPAYDRRALSPTVRLSRRANPRLAPAERASRPVRRTIPAGCRQTKDLVALIEVGAKVITLDGEIDLSSRDGELRATMLAGFARFEIRHKAERMVRANTRT
jgi:hypothetical protein